MQISQESGRITLDSGQIKLVFKTDDNQLSLQSISDGQVEHVDSCENIWKLTLQQTDGESIDISAGDVSLTKVTTGKDRVEFVWTPDIAGESVSVTVIVRIEENDPLSYWSLEASLPEGFKVTRTDFPIIPGIRLKKGLKMAVPAGWGLEYDLKPGTEHTGVYPSCLAAMQFIAFYEGGNGLYIGSHDSDGNHKQFAVRANERKADFALTNFPAIPNDAQTTYRIPFETAIGVFDGDYYDAAQIYREFTFNTLWGQAGPVSKRPIPEWIKETDLWLRPDGSVEDNVEITKRALDYFDANTSCHWYRWHVIPYDTLYPEYFPALPGFTEGVKTLQDAGTHIMPYINGRLCDPNSKTWNEENGHRSAARDENGSPYTEIYGSKVPLNAMCPYTKQWQDKVADLVRTLIDDYGVHGVYIDQIGAAYPVQCFNPDHGHPVGGGNFWHHGYRKMLDQIRDDLPEGVILTTEENAECWIDQFDALLLVNTPTGEPSPIPLFPAVYSGRTITFGFLYYPADDLERSLPFILKNARAFIYGAQLGWIQPARIMAPEAAKEAEFLRTLARCRRHAHKFVTYGRFLGLLNVEGDNPRITGEGSGSFSGTYSIDTPSVIASAWLAEDGSLGVLLTNISEEPHEVQFDLPLVKAGLAGPIMVERFGPEGLEASRESTSATQDVAIEGYGAVVFVASNVGSRIFGTLPTAPSRDAAKQP